MPNWCTNEISIESDNKALKLRLQKALDLSQDLFCQFIPRPAEFDEGEKWYQWNIDHWGTKWDVTPINIEWKGRTVKFQIETAWSPPIKFYQEMESLGYKVDAYYLEEGMAFTGHFHSNNNELIDYSDFSSADKMEEKLPPWAEEVFGLITRQRDREQEELEDAQRELEASWEKTEWIKSSTPPIRNGLYEVRVRIAKNRFTFPQKNEWVSGKWTGGIKVAEWRGLTKLQHDQLASDGSYSSANESNNLNVALDELKAAFDKLLNEE